MSKGTLKQILLLTDGHSNQGEDPVAIAALAREQGITVNVIGVVDDNHLNEKGIEEIEAIALAGGGVSQVVYAKQLAKTVQMVTRKAMTQTIHGVVNKELQQILGQHQEMEDLSPDKRGQVMEVVDELGETMDLDIFVLVDTSASMKNKLPMVQEALVDLSISLTSRMGANRFALYSFPGKRKEIDKLLDWTPQLSSLTGIFQKLSSGGITPTGPALKTALQKFTKSGSRRSLIAGDKEQLLEESGM
ncbi:vWA domain-containing protein [Halalkalibacter nanhaiisediminis]|uniref:Ca-activated chloride channel family protein n=1 Tax=Halalkalibacter nanhaiisediminis TaxID=688079 RepID=A0A562Q8X9_9BACI|nr:VWA domain-containing protein [Halalkalibacter nanhaiisediminis]TWI53215.1 Ca-activated chloride channel family protein [Halalkalibacter nanhaiisediminis]